MLPFSNMPYGPAPAWCFPLTEACMYIITAICVWHAYRKGIGHISWLLGGLCFGLLLEYINVYTSSGYFYGRFTIMLGTAPRNIPFCIGCGWAVIIYSSRLFSDRLGLPLWAAAALDSLLALNIDLSMDVVAYRLHMWHWDWVSRGLPGNALSGQWFGVPYGNFYGWLLVVFFYSLFGRLLERVSGKAAWKAVFPLLSVLLSQIALYISLFPLAALLKSLWGITSLHRLIFILLMLMVFVCAGFRRRQPVAAVPWPLAAWIVPVWFHVYFLCWLFLGGFSGENNLMTTAAVLNAAIGLLIHLPPLFRKPGITFLTDRR
ncbi:carotenoid biosynthesis protein [Chitinophaga sp. Mgbs1]|uniref:Carotenoid biosynthesis protein n=1 Tax=Chitinophaga solisilvae TaxID=1233460 RepID=A0A3S1CYG8_9BACT|nr:carotenoid biosynthesis protein [Chitinophaga solisilvae]